MGLFSKRSREQKNDKTAVVTVAAKEVLSSQAVKIVFDIPESSKTKFNFIPGQYVNIHITLNGKEEHRSYSICSGTKENLAIGVKAVDKGLVSSYLVNELKVGSEVKLSFPQGNFIVPKNNNSLLAFVTGSGITPVLSIAKELNPEQNLTLVYGNKTYSEELFKEEVRSLKNTELVSFYSQEVIENTHSGRLDKQGISEYLKAHLNLLRADVFLLCGPEEMIVGAIEVLTVFGIPKEKIVFELFTTPVLMKNETPVEKGSFKGESELSAVMDGEIVRVKLKTDGESVLDALDKQGMDVPYSCKGGVCCSCKAKIIEGSARMVNNFGLTDQEVAQGYILTCQSHPTSEILKIDFDA